jgi:hypothetical protein
MDENTALKRKHHATTQKGVTFQPALSFQVTPNPMRHLMHQLRQFSAVHLDLAEK